MVVKEAAAKVQQLQAELAAARTELASLRAEVSRLRAQAGQSAEEALAGLPDAVAAEYRAREAALRAAQEARLAQFLAQKQVDAAALRSVTVAQLGDELKLRRLGSFAEEWKTLTQSDALPYIGVGTVSAKLADSQPQTVARVIAALRDTLAWGDAHPDEVVAILKKSANLPENDARVYVGQWSAMNRLSFEPQDMETLRREHQVFTDAGLIKGELKPDLFTTEPYAQSKNLK